MRIAPTVASQGAVTVRSYRGVVDEVERRIFRIDRWRLPTPYGVSVRAVIYGITAFCAALIAARLPGLGLIVGAIPSSVRLGALPLLAAWGLSAWRVDGRPPHRALGSVAMFAGRAKTRAGLRRCPPIEARFAPIAAIQVAPAGDEPRYRRGRVKGPATITLAYPARIQLAGAGRRTGADLSERLASASSVRVSGAAAGARPLAIASKLRVPAGKEIVFR